MRKLITRETLGSWLPVFALAVILALATGALAGTTEPESGYTLSVKDGFISLEAAEADLWPILEEILRKFSLEPKIKGKADRVINVRFENLSIDRALRKILKNNYALVYSRADGREIISSIRLFESGGNAFIHLDEEKETAFVEPEPGNLDNIKDYIESRNRYLDRMAAEKPQEVLRAQVSFNEFMPATMARDIIASSSLKVREIAHGWKNQGGGYILYGGETFDQAIANMTLAQKRFFHHMQESEQYLLEMAKEDRELGDSAAEMLSQLRERKEMLNAAGPTIFGFQVEGEVRELKNMKDSHREVRLVDLEVTNKETERLKAEGYEMAPHFILISPQDK